MTIGQHVLGWCDAWMQRHPWDHNAHHHDWILRRLPARVDRALDVGCGTGDLVRRLGARARSVEGVDIDPSMVEHARRIDDRALGATFTCADVLDLDRPGHHDAVTAVAVLHHLPLERGLRQLRTLLAPGGTLVVLGLYREETLGDHLTSLVALPANLVVGTWQTWRRGPGAPPSAGAPTATATTTLAEVRRAAAREVPGAVVRRHLFWRFSLVWTRP